MSRRGLHHLNHAAADHRAGVPGGLCGEIIRIPVYDYRVPQDVPPLEAVGEKDAPGESVMGGEEGRHISGMSGMLTAAGIVMTVCIGKGLCRRTGAGGSCMDMEAEDMVAADGIFHRQAVDLRVDKDAAHNGIEADDSMQVGIFAAAVDRGIGGGRFIEQVVQIV